MNPIELETRLLKQKTPKNASQLKGAISKFLKSWYLSMLVHKTRTFSDVLFFDFNLSKVLTSSGRKYGICENISKIS